MELLPELILMATPLMLVSLGALVSERAGVMAVYADGLINLGAFIFYAVTVFTNSIFFGVLCSLVICVFIAFISAYLTKTLNANPFLTGLALNVGVSGIITFSSVQIFGTRGVIAFSDFTFTANTQTLLVCIAWFVIILSILILIFTKIGLYLKITGSYPEVLIAKGIKPDYWKIFSWCVAGFFSAFAGCLLVISLSSYVPNISAGCGWTALAVVFLGRKKIAGVFIAAAIFTVTEYVANNIQNIQFLSNIPSAWLLALPYTVALILIALDFKHKKQGY